MGFFNQILGQNNVKKDFSKLIQDGAFLVDVRTAEEFAEGHVKGSTNIPLDQVPSHLDQFDHKNHIIVFCKSGNRSGHAKMILEQNGFQNISNGGTWQDINACLSNIND